MLLIEEKFCMKNTKMQLIELIEKIDNEKVLNRIKYVLLGVKDNKNKRA